MRECDAYWVIGDHGACSGTKEVEQCNCGGDVTRCDFYPEKKWEAILKEARESGKENMRKIDERCKKYVKSHVVKRDQNGWKEIGDLTMREVNKICRSAHSCSQCVLMVNMPDGDFGCITDVVGTRVDPSEKFTRLVKVNRD